MKSNSWRRMITQPCSPSPKGEVKKLQFGVISSGSCCCQWGRGTTVHSSGSLNSSTWTFNLFFRGRMACGSCLWRKWFFCPYFESPHDAQLLPVGYLIFFTKLAFPANHYVCPTKSFTLPICQPCGTCQREQIRHEKLLYNLWPWAETADLTTQQPLPGNFWMTLQKSKPES